MYVALVHFFPYVYRGLSNDLFITQKCVHHVTDTGLILCSTLVVVPTPDSGNSGLGNALITEMVLSKNIL